MSDEISGRESNLPEGVAFINTFHTSEQDGQTELIESLALVTEDVIRHQTGFISATIHRSLDGKTVTNVARWRSAADFKRALETPEMLAHREVLRGRYPREGYLGQVVYIYNSQESDAK